MLSQRSAAFLLGLSFQLPPSPFRPHSEPVPRHVLYRGKGLLLFRMLVRGKVFQLLGFFMVAVMVTVMLSAVSRAGF